MKTSNKRSLGFSIGVLTLIVVCALVGLRHFWQSQDQHQTDESSESLKTSALKKSSNSAILARNKIPDSTTVSSNNAASISAAASRKVAQSSEPQSLEKFLKELDPNADWRVNKTDTGRVTAISGALIQGQSDSTEEPEGLLKFAQQIAELTGVSGAQITVSTTRLEDTPETRAHQFDQEVEGYKVFGGYMKIFTRKSDNAIYYIANETRDVGEVDLRIKYTGPEAAQIALRAYSDKKGVVVDSVSGKPVIYPDQAIKQGELAWEVIVSIAGPLFDRRHLLISARSGQILKDVSLVVH